MGRRANVGPIRPRGASAARRLHVRADAELLPCAPDPDEDLDALLQRGARLAAKNAEGLTRISTGPIFVSRGDTVPRGREEADVVPRSKGPPNTVFRIVSLAGDCRGSPVRRPRRSTEQIGSPSPCTSRDGPRWQGSLLSPAPMLRASAHAAGVQDGRCGAQRYAGVHQPRQRGKENHCEQEPGSGCSGAERLAEW